FNCSSRTTPQLATMTTNGHVSSSIEHTVKRQKLAPSDPLDGIDPVKNNWDSPGPAAFDFRSDVVTTPTPSMLTSIAQTTLLDDVFVEDPTTLSLEARTAELTGHEAALLVLSGTMGNQLSLRSHLLAPPHSVLTDYRGHILEWEAGGVASLCGALVKGIRPRNEHHITLEDVEENAVISDDVHACPTKVISLENTLGGTILPLEECQRISAWAKERGILMHLDGARLWEACAAGAGSLEEYCACFDSVSLCFSKGLGAPIGSIIVGKAPFIKRARWIRKSIGGGLRQAGVVAAPARVALEETFLGGKLSATHENARQIGKFWEQLGGKLALPVETNMVWLDLDDASVAKKDFVTAAEKLGLRVLKGRLVVHYQIGNEAIAKLEILMRELLNGDGVDDVEGSVKIDPMDTQITVE
ncbi:MAG: hypothetical protein M1820_003490, partial [Bogoriella megaspora]